MTRTRDLSDNMLAYPNPYLDISTPTQYYNGQELVRVEILAQMATATMLHGKQMFRETPLLLRGQEVWLHPAQIDESPTKVKLLDVAEDESNDLDGTATSEDYRLSSRRGMVIPADPAMIPEVVGAVSTLAVPEKSDLEEVAPSLSTSQSSEARMPTVRAGSATEDGTSGDAAVEAAQRSEAASDPEPETAKGDEVTQELKEEPVPVNEEAQVKQDAPAETKEEPKAPAPRGSKGKVGPESTK